MKNLLYFLIFLAFISCTSNSETKTAESSDTEQTSSTNTNQEKKETKELKTVEDIRAEFQLIQSKITSGKMDSTSFNYECPGESGNMTFFSENGELRRVRHGNGGDHYGITKDFFLKDNVPFFIYHEEGSWVFDVESGVESATKDDIAESRFYIVDGKLIKCLQKEFTIRSSVKNNPTSASVANKEMTCPDLKELLKDFEFALKYKNQKTNLEDCLE